MIKKLGLFLMASILIGSACAQPLLSLEEAVSLGLQNNFSILLSHDQAASAAINMKKGQGQFLPSASASLNHSGRVDGDARQTRVGASLNWLVFDGFQTYHAYHQLQSQEQSAKLEERAGLEAMIESVTLAYFDIVQQIQRLKAIQELLAVSEERGKLANAKLEIGAGSSLEQWQSITDLNSDSSSLLNQTVSLHNAKVKLNQLMARDPGLDFLVTDSIPLSAALPLDDWRSILLDNNTKVAAARANREASQSALAEARGNWLPNLNTGLAYSQAPDAFNSPGMAADGDVTYSINLSMPIFDQFTTPTGISRAKVNLHQEEIRLKQAESDAVAAFEQARAQYASGLKLVALEERNSQVSRLQAEGARERYRVGASTPLEFRDAQTKLLDAKVRLITARQNVKQAELALQKLTGLLVKSAPTDGEGK